ncbi:MAG: oligosaccharide flippase family protein [Planctomycetota bacterium]
MLRSVSSNWSLNALQIVVFMVLTGFVQRTLGDGSYGIWETIVSNAGILQLLALGLPMATVRAVSSSLGGDDPDEAARTAGTSLTITLALGAIAAGVSVLVYGGFELLFLGNEDWAALPEDRVQDARSAMIVMLANVCAGFALALPYALYDAQQDFVARNLIKGSGMIAKLVSTMLLLSWRADLVVLAWIQVGVAALEFLVALTVSRRRHPDVPLRPRRVEWRVARGLLGFSVFSFLLNMGAMLAFRIDALVIGANGTEVDVAVYSYGNKVFDPFINVLLAIGMVLMPMAATQARRGELDDVRTAFLKWSKIAATIVFLIGGYLLVVGPQFLDWWLDSERIGESGRLLRILMLSFFFFLPIRGVALPVLMGLGRAKAPGIGLLVMGLANLGLSLALVGPLGIVGVALGTAIPNVVFGLFFGRTACRALEVRGREWLGYAFARPLAVAVVAAGALFGASLAVPIEGFATLFFAGLVYTGLFGLLALVFAFRGDRYIDVKPVLSRIPGLSALAR